MFRRVQPPVQKVTLNDWRDRFPEDLEKLGLYVNDDDAIRQIAAPEKRYEYKMYKEDRLNELRREAKDECLRRMVKDRLRRLDMLTMTVPVDAKEGEKNIPIMISDDLESNKNRVLIFIPPNNHDLGFWSTRIMEDETFNEGCMVNSINKAKAAGFSTVISNPGQNIWSSTENRAVTYTTWKATNKPSANIDPNYNAVPGNETPDEHVKYVLEHVVSKLAPKEASVFVFAAGHGAQTAVKYFNAHWDDWKSRLQALALCESTHNFKEVTNKDFSQFLMDRGRAYIIYNYPRGEIVMEKENRFGCPTFSAEASFADTVAALVQHIVLDWFQIVRDDPENCNPKYFNAKWDDDNKNENQELVAEMPDIKNDMSEEQWKMMGIEDNLEIKNLQEEARLADEQREEEKQNIMEAMTGDPDI